MPLFLGVYRSQSQSLSPKGTKGALAAGQNDDLHIAGLSVQRVEHPLDPVVIGKDQRVVQDHRRDAPRAGQHPRKGQPYQKRHLFLCAT
tara:strand:- start:223 stop:489 length:267 start_codon:yes stop_codon:yes gene_type:complete